MTSSRSTKRQLLVWWAAGTAAVLMLCSPVSATAAQAHDNHSQRASATVATAPLNPALSGLWCASASKCLAVGGDQQSAPVSETWNGRAWTYVKTPATGTSVAGFGFTGLSCRSWTRCMAVGLGKVTDLWNGSTWRVLPSHDPATLYSVSCPGQDLCIAVGAMDYAHGFTGAVVWHGKSWQAMSVPKPPGAKFASLSSVACASATRCVAVGSYGNDHFTGPMAAAWNGTSWQLTTVPAGDEMTSVACPAAGDCIAVGSGPHALAAAEQWNGATWTAATTPAGLPALSAVTCTSTTFCLAVNGTAAVSWNGTAWSALAAPVSIGGLAAVWCGSSRDCMAVGTGGPGSSLAEQWNGTAWRVLRTNRVDSLGGVWCTEATDCTAVGSWVGPADQGQTLAERWNGRTWQTQATPAEQAGLNSVSCPTLTFCMAVGDTPGLVGMAERWNGHRWSAVAVPGLGYGSELYSVSCASPSSCVATGRQDLAVIWNGTSWKVDDATVTGYTVSLSAVSCSSPQDCIAVGYAYLDGCTSCNQCAQCDGTALTVLWNGKAWNAHIVTPGGDPGDVSCPTTSFCMAVDGSGALTLEDKTWHRQKVTAHDALDNVSCSSATNCMATGWYTIGGTGTVVSVAELWNGKIWRAVQSAGPGGDIGTVSCISAKWCVGVGSANGQTAAQAWNGTRWTLLRTQNP
jgi:hypothetical protein